VALVFVTATVPAEGARQGDRLHCEVSAVSAKSLEGGRLMLAPLRGPRPGNPRVYAFAQGQIALDASGPPTVGKVHNGCRLEENFDNVFAKDGKITLVLDKSHASFQTAADIAELLNNPRVSGFSPGRGQDGDPAPPDAIAKARDQVNIDVQIPDLYLKAGDLVGFVSAVLETQIIPPRHDAMVVVDKRNGVIVVGENVTVGRVAVSHKNVAVQTGTTPGAEGPLLVVDQLQDTSTTRLKALVDALNALKVSTTDIIHIVENLEKSGDLYGRLIVR
jgi:flagellar P-ring protein precursor FlgI